MASYCRLSRQMATGEKIKIRRESYLLLLGDLIEKVLEKLECVLVHDPEEVLVPLAKLVD